MDGRPKRIKKFVFTCVCVYNRLRVDGALEWILRKKFQHDNHVGFSFFSQSVNWILLDSIVISVNNY